MNFKKIGVLTSGGDAPGMNAVIRAITRAANVAGVETVGIYEGYQGLMDGKIVRFTPENVSNIIGRAGTILYTARATEFKQESGMQKAIKTCRDNKIDGIIAIGGDGTFRGARDLTAYGIPAICLTGTIDNDITATDYTVGFDSAMNTVVDCVDNVRDTCESHSRCAIVEVMGRNAGYIALRAGIATGAVGIVISEIEFDEEVTLNKIAEARKNGQRSFVILVAEGVSDEFGKPYGESLAVRVQERTGVETRFVRIAHIVRGGAPTLRDRLTGSLMGEAAVKLMLEGKSNLVVCERAGKIVPCEINYALTLDKMYKRTLKDGDLDGFTNEQIKEMEEFVQYRRDEIKEMYDAAMTLTYSSGS